MQFTILTIFVRKLPRLGALALVVGLMPLGGDQAQAANVQCKAMLSTPGTSTTLHESLRCSGPGPAITISANDITLKCTNNAILSGKGVGIFLDNVSGVTVMNCDIRHFAAGIHLSGSSGNELKNNMVTGSTSKNGGFTLVKSSDGNTLFNNTANDNTGRGFVLHNSSNNTLRNNRADGNGFRAYDITLNSNGNTLTNNRATKNLSAGYVVFKSTGNLLENNRSTGSEYEGFAVLQAPENIFTNNTAKSNGTFGFRDNTTGNGTLGTANNYNKNKCELNETGSSPTPLCTPQQP